MSGQELQPFCVESEHVTEEELNLILEKCVVLGAYPSEAVDGTDSRGFTCRTTFYMKDEFLYWGVDTALDTCTSDFYIENFDGNLLTKEEAFIMLDIDTKEILHDL